MKNRPLKTVGAIALVLTGFASAVALLAPWRMGSAQPAPVLPTSRSGDAGGNGSRTDANTTNSIATSNAAALAQANDTDEELVVDTPSLDGGVVTVRLAAPDANTLVARGRNVTVTAGEVLQLVQDANEFVRGLWASDPRQMETVVDRLMADRLMVQEAKRLGLENDPLVKSALERALIARLRATVINPSVGDGTRITDDEIRNFYNTHPERFHFPERRSVRVIFSTDRTNAGRLWRLATTRHHGHMPDFRKLARENNLDPELLRTNGIINDISLDRADLDIDLRRAIFAMTDEDTFAPAPVRANWAGTPGYFIVRLNNIRKAIDRPLEDEADWIRQRLVLERRVSTEDDLVRRLVQQSAVVRTPVEQCVQLVLPDGGLATVPADAGDASTWRRY